MSVKYQPCLEVIASPTNADYENVALCQPMYVEGEQLKKRSSTGIFWCDSIYLNKGMFDWCL